MTAPGCTNVFGPKWGSTIKLSRCFSHTSHHQRPLESHEYVIPLCITIRLPPALDILIIDFTPSAPLSLLLINPVSFESLKLSMGII